MMKNCLQLWLACVGFGVGSSVHAEAPLTLAGINVVPHQQSPNMRYRRPPDPGLGARVELFLKNDRSEGIPINSKFKALFDGKTPAQLLKSEDWAWHDMPSARTNLDLVLPPGTMTVWSFNSRSNNWGTGTSHFVSFGGLYDESCSNSVSGSVSTATIDRCSDFINASATA